MEKHMFKSGRPRGRHNSAFEMAAFPQEKEPGLVPGSLETRFPCEKCLAPLFLLGRFFRRLLGGLLFWFRFGLLFWRGLLFRRFLRRWP